MMAEVLLPSDKAFLRRYPHQLSGGQQQRVAIAMAFANRPKVIVLDEPTTALDVTTQAHVLDTIRDLTKSYGVAALYVTHDLAVVSSLADRIAVMYAGRLVEIGTARRAVRRRPATRTRASCSRPSPTSPGERALRGIPGLGAASGHSARRAAPSRRAATGPSTSAARSSRRWRTSSPGHRVRCWRYQEVGAQQAATDIHLRDKSLSAPRAEEEQVISVRDVTAYYQHKEILHGIDATLASVAASSLVGESGRGKTTLARCIAGLHPFKIVGDIEFMGKPLARDARGRSRAIRQAIQYIFQSPYSSLNPRKTIAQILSQPLKVFFDLSRDEMEDRMVEVLEQVALDVIPAEPLPGPAVRRRAPARGHRARPRRRADGARSATRSPRGSTSPCRRRSSSCSSALQREIGSVHAVRHPQPRAGPQHRQEVAVMNEGRIVEYGLVDAVLEDPQADYTKKLLSDTPTM